MNRPWKVWLWFALALALVVPALGWLTHKALQLDAAVTTSARTADLEEDISLALWRMDVALAPLVAQEAARPYVVYRPFLVPTDWNAATDGQPQVSPLLVQPSEFVRLHFQLEEDGELSSPQCPAEGMRELAIDNGAPLGNIKLSCDKLSQLSETIQHDALAARLPRETLPPFEVTDLAWDNRLHTENLNANEAPDEFDQQVLVQNDAPNQDLQVAEIDPYDGNFYGYGRTSRAQGQRGQVEFNRRNKALQSYANTEVVRQRKQLPPVSLPTSKVQEGVSAPLWVENELLLARRVKVDDREVIQGVWFDWEKLKPFLIAEGLGADEALAAALPDFDLRPITDDRQVIPARRLATLPVEIVVPTPKFTSAALSPIRLSLWIAWACCLLATGAIAMLLQGVITLSERRGAFVSAVTHELRTPLTTFRMYAEMLSAGMVSDPAQRQQYTDTLRVEAERLSHLVENVLAYARLERGRNGGRREKVSLDNVLQRATSRLEDRAQQAEMGLVVDIPDELREAILHTDPQAVEQILFNLVDNACKYAQTATERTITITATRHPKAMSIHITDHGPGISATFAKKLFQPFSKSVEDAAVSAPGVGLGLALCQRLAGEIGGSLELESSDDGASFRLTLPIVPRHSVT